MTSNSSRTLDICVQITLDSGWSAIPAGIIPEIKDVFGTKVNVQHLAGCQRIPKVPMRRNEPPILKTVCNEGL